MHYITCINTVGRFFLKIVRPFVILSNALEILRKFITIGCALCCVSHAFQGTFKAGGSTFVPAGSISNIWPKNAELHRLLKVDAIFGVFSLWPPLANAAL